MAFVTVRRTVIEGIEVQPGARWSGSCAGSVELSAALDYLHLFNQVKCHCMHGNCTFAGMVQPLIDYIGVLHVEIAVNPNFLCVKPLVNLNKFCV